MTAKQVYTIGKWVALVGLPALAFLVLAINGIWDIPDQDRIVATITVIDTFLGTLLHVKVPYDGTAYVEPGADLDDPKKLTLDLRQHMVDPAKVEKQKVLRLKVLPKRAA